MKKICRSLPQLGCFGSDHDVSMRTASDGIVSRSQTLTQKSLAICETSDGKLSGAWKLGHRYMFWMF